MRLRIGKLAAAVGVSPHTIRYYEKLHLLPRANRTYAGYRMYTEEDVKRLRFIKQAQKIGFSLNDINQVLLRGKAGLEECQRIRDLLNSKLGEIDQWMAEMVAFREVVAGCRKECEEALGGARGDCCPVLSELDRATNVVEEPEVVSTLKTGKSSAQSRRETAMTEKNRSGRLNRPGGTRHYCEPLLHGTGLARSQANKGVRRSNHI